MQRLNIVDNVRNNLNARRPTANNGDSFIRQIDSVIPFGGVHCGSIERIELRRNVRNSKGTQCHDSNVARVTDS